MLAMIQEESIVLSKEIRTEGKDKKFIWCHCVKKQPTPKSPKGVVEQNLHGGKSDHSHYVRTCPH